MGEFRAQFSLGEGRKASDALLHSKRMGRIGMIKEGLYFTVRPGQTSVNAPVDPFLLASRLEHDALLSFHTALDALGYGHSDFNTYFCFSNQARPPLRFRGQQFRVVLTPGQLRKKFREDCCIEKVERLGVKILVTGKERTLVECLERPKYCGGFEEMYRSLEKIPFLHPDVLLEYLDLREQKTLYARVGYFLEQHRGEFQVEESLLRRLAANIPSRPVYWTRPRTGGVLAKRWSLIVPDAVHTRRWEER